jgi:hypothetical protein
MYQVIIHHHDKAWRRGDLEDDLFLIAQVNFKTRTAAKNYIESDIPKRRCQTVHRDYHKGNQSSLVWAYTGVTWQHENSGEQMQEYYRYELKKVKLRG